MISTVIDFFETPVSVRRVTEATEFVDGLAQVVTTVDEFELRGVSVQPMSPRERMLLPELIRDRGALLAHSKCPLQTTDVEAKTRADRVTYGGQQYVVHSVEDWTAHGGAYRCVLLREDD